MRKALSIFLIFVIALSVYPIRIYASGVEDEGDKIQDADLESIDINAKAAILMDATTGAVLYTKNAAEALPPASVPKIMTLLLVAEAIADGRITVEQKVRVSSNAASKGGSQIFIKEGEEFTVDELLKSTVIASANDAAVALAELVSGSESAFVGLMNERARELGMKNTCFENATGLDDSTTHHLTSAYDIALMSRELLKYDTITKYSNIWQDSIRNGEFVLTNTNRLVRYYDGCTGLKTGSTDKAGFCISATAERDGMHLIAVIMGAETRDERNNAARMLLDFGFANYALYKDTAKQLESIPVLYGKSDNVLLSSTGFSKLVSKSEKGRIEAYYDIPDQLTAPIKKGDAVGKITYKIEDKVIGECDICVDEDVPKITFAELYCRLLKTIFTGAR